jgi:Uncharacterized protein conserved in bacteria (DUF2188)
MTIAWTPEQKRIRSELTKVKKYPRWKHWAGGSLYYVHPDLWAEEVFKHFDGTWQVGNRGDEKCRYFDTLQEALEYGERLAEVRVRSHFLNEARICRALKVTRLAVALPVDPDKLPVGITASQLR